MPSPTCLVNNWSTETGYNAAQGDFLTISLADKTGVNSWSLTCIGTDDGYVVANVNALLSYNTVSGVYTIQMPLKYCAFIFQSVINNGLDANGNYQNSYKTNFEISIPEAKDNFLIVQNQTVERSAAFGWSTDINALIATGIPKTGNISQAELATEGNLSAKSITMVQTDGYTNLPKGIWLQTKIISGATTTYTIDTATNDTVIFNQSTTNLAIHLPAPTLGRFLCLIDNQDPMDWHEPTLVAHATEKISGEAGPIYLSQDCSYSLTSDGTDWYFVENI